MEKKLSIPFVNDGKPFKISNWTVEKHEKTLQLLQEHVGNKPAEEQDKLFRYYVIYVGFLEVDSNIELAEVLSLHVENVMELFEVIYYAGKIDIFFHKPLKQKGQNKN